MSDDNRSWRSPGREDLSQTRNRWLIGGAILGLVVLAWIFMSRPSDETIPTGAFDVRGGGTVAAPTFRERRSETGLAMVRRNFDGPPPGAQPDNAPAAPPPDQAAPAPAAENAPAAPAPGAPGAPGAAKPAGPDTGKLSDIGAPSDKGGLTRLGAQKGLLSALVNKALEHPTALKLLLNNKTLVDAYFSRDLVQKNCSSGAALKAYLTNGSDPNGVSEEMNLAKAMLSHPDAASAAIGSEFGQRLMDCPAVKELEKDPGAALVIIGSNPGAMALMTDPNARQVISSNPQAAGLFGAAQSSMGAGAGGGK